MEQPSLDDRMWKRGHSQVKTGEHILHRGACGSVHSIIMISTKVEPWTPKRGSHGSCDGRRRRIRRNVSSSLKIAEGLTTVMAEDAVSRQRF